MHNESVEMEDGGLSHASKVVIVDDVLSIGKTLCAVLQLLSKLGLPMENVEVMVVAEMPTHRGRLRLRENRFGMVRVQSLLVFGGE